MKKNAWLSIILCITLLIHVIYQAAAYIMFFYAPLASKILGYAVVVPMIFHAFLSMLSIFVLHDSKTVLYKTSNIGTCVQRISGIIGGVLLPIHILSFMILSQSVGSYVFYLTESSQILFYAAIFAHIAVSFSKAFVTLGILENPRKKRFIDRLLWVVCIFLFVIMCVLIIRTHRIIFGI